MALELNPESLPRSVSVHELLLPGLLASESPASEGETTAETLSGCSVADVP